jgi:hypothetical protein
MSDRDPFKGKRKVIPLRPKKITRYLPNWDFHSWMIIAVDSVRIAEKEILAKSMIRKNGK